MSKTIKNPPTIREASEKLAVHDFLDYRLYLQGLYDFMKANSPQYSYLKFSNDLGLSESNVSWLLITNRRKITPSSLKKICTTLDLKHKARIYFETLVKYNNSRKPQDQQLCLDKLLKLKLEYINENSQDSLEYFSEWYYPIIRELVTLKNFQPSADWIAKNLNCRLLPQQIDNSLQLLLKLGLITWDLDQQNFIQVGGSIKPDRQVARFAAIRYHEQMLQMAQESLIRVPAKERDYNCMSLRLDDEQMQAAKKILKDALSAIFALEQKSGTESERLFQINVQVFPLTKRSNS